MRQIINNHICCMIIITMFITGMCMDSKQAYAFFADSTLENQPCTYFIQSHDDTIIAHSACTQRMLGISEFSFINHNVSHAHIRAKVRTSLISVVANLCMIRFVILNRAKENTFISKVCMKARVLNYIHKQDGKK